MFAAIFSLLSAASGFSELSKNWFSHTCINLDQFSIMFCWRNTKSKLKLSLAGFALIFSIFKFVQFLIYTWTIASVISDEDCNVCLVEYSELAFIISIFIPLTLLIYGAIKVRMWGEGGKEVSWLIFSFYSWVNHASVCGWWLTCFCWRSTCTCNMKLGWVPTATNIHSALLLQSQSSSVSSPMLAEARAH